MPETTDDGAVVIVALRNIEREARRMRKFVSGDGFESFSLGDIDRAFAAYDALRELTKPVMKSHGADALTRRDKLACALADAVSLAFANDVPPPTFPVWDWWRARFNETLKREGVTHEW